MLFNTAVQIVGRHFNRWRTADLWFSRALDHENLLHYLRRPSPVLTRFHLVSHHSNLSPDRTYLPVAPNLGIMDIYCANFRCSPRHGGFRSLTSLGIYHICPATQLVELLSACAQTLETLVLYYVETTTGIEGLPIKLPALTSLAVSKRIRAHEFFIVPVLRTLVIDALVSMSPFVEQVRSTVIGLTLFQGSENSITSVMDVSHLISLSCLDRLETLSFLPVPLIGVQKLKIRNGVFSHLAQSAPPIWPALQRIDIGKLVSVDEDGTTWEEELIQFVQTRNPPLAETASTDEQLPSRLRESYCRL